MMYRKITHNIVEEHFDHPMAEQIKKTIERKATVPTDIVFDKAAFENELLGFVNEYSRKIIDMLKSMKGNTDTFISYFESIFDGGADKLGNMTKDFYSYELGERLNIIMRGMAVAAYTNALASKFGKQDVAANTRLEFLPNDAANALGSFNRTDWDFFVVQKAFEDLVNAISSLTKSSQTSDVTKIDADAKAVSQGFAAVGNLILKGLFNTFPDRFTTTPAMMNVNDIM